jgi:hypothetical protein
VASEAPWEYHGQKYRDRHGFWCGFYKRNQSSENCIERWMKGGFLNPWSFANGKMWWECEGHLVENRDSNHLGLQGLDSEGFPFESHFFHITTVNSWKPQGWLDFSMKITYKFGDNIICI